MMVKPIGKGMRTGFCRGIGVWRRRVMKTPRWGRSANQRQIWRTRTVQTIKFGGGGYYQRARG